MNNAAVTIKQEPVWGSAITAASTADLAEYFSRQGIPLNLQQFLKFNPENIKREVHVESSPPINGQEGSENSQETQPAGSIVITANSGGGGGGVNQPPPLTAINGTTNTTVTTAAAAGTTAATTATTEIDQNGKVKKKRKYKKKPPKPKPPKPGQVHIATAMDGTILFCCPECQMAYPDKSNLEQHLSVHKIERRYICDICGAGLKRKEHLERHKLGHSPERPYICSVCMKGFKRKEHLNLHFVIHSGDKSEVGINAFFFLFFNFFFVK